MERNFLKHSKNNSPASHSGDQDDKPEQKDPAAAKGAAYITYIDGEGQAVQMYQFPTAEVGDYVVAISNALETESVAYHLEIFLDSTITLTGVASPYGSSPVAARRRRMPAARLPTKLVGYHSIVHADIVAHIASRADTIERKKQEKSQKDQETQEK